MQRVTFNGREAFERRFNTAEDLKGKAFTVIIKRIEPVTVHTKRGSRNKLAIHFERTARPFILGKEFAESIARALDNYEIDAWEGEAIIIYPAPTPLGDTVLARPVVQTTEQEIEE